MEPETRKKHKAAKFVLLGISSILATVILTLGVVAVYTVYEICSLPYMYTTQLKYYFVHDEAWKSGEPINKTGDLYRIKGLPKSYLYYRPTMDYVSSVILSNSTGFVKHKLSKDPCWIYSPYHMAINSASAGEHFSFQTEDENVMLPLFQLCREKKHDDRKEDLPRGKWLKITFLLEPESGLSWNGEDARIDLFIGKNGSVDYYFCCNNPDYRYNEPEYGPHWYSYGINELMQTPAFSSLRETIEAYYLK